MTFALDRSKVLSLPVPAFSPAPGDPNSAFGPSLGDFRIEVGASATQIVGRVPSGGIEKIGETNPAFKLTFVNDFVYKGWSLYSLFDWRQGSDIVNLNTLISDLAQTTRDFAENGADRLGSFGTDARAFLESGTYVKLREITLAYDLPEGLVRKIWSSFRRVRLSLSARDLFVWTDYNGLDPEVSNFGSQSIGRNIDTSPYPPSRSLWFSIDFGF
jgi:hypothetical protein